LQRNDRRQQRLNRFSYKDSRLIAKNRHVTASGTETQSTAQVDGHSAKDALSDTVISTVHVCRASSAEGAALQLQGGMSSQSTRCYLYIIRTALIETPREIRGAARLNRSMCHLRSMARRATMALLRRAGPPGLGRKGVALTRAEGGAEMAVVEATRLHSRLTEGNGHVDKREVVHCSNSAPLCDTV
jgi:hypothetical protein